MWTLPNAKKDSDKFFGPKRTPTIRLLNLKFSGRRQQRLSPGPKSHKGRGRFQPVHASEESAGHCRKKLGGEESLSPLPIQTLSEDMDDRINLAHKVVDVVERTN